MLNCFKKYLNFNYPFSLNNFFYLIILFVIFASLLKIYFSPDGWLTGDSYGYLNHANSIRTGSFFYTCNPISNTKHFFSTWPIGYSLLIGGFSFVSGLDVFISSKILNFVFLVVIGFYFKKYLKNNILLIFLLFSVLLIKYIVLTLSEFVFIVLCFAFVFELTKSKFNPLVICLGFLIFLTRYLGVFILPFLVILFLFYRKREYLIYFVSIFIFVFTYLTFVKLNVGFISGAERIGTSQSRFVTFYEITKAFFSLFSFFDFENLTGKTGRYLFFAGILFFIPIIKQISILLTREITNQVSFHLLLLGTVYLITYSLIIILPDWRHDDDSISNRFLMPGFMFLIVGGINEVKFSFFSKVFVVIGLIFSFLFNGFVKPYLDYMKYNGFSYLNNIENIISNSEPSYSKERHILYLKICDQN